MIAERIDHRNRRVSGQGLEVGMPKYPRDDRIHPEREIPGEVLDALSLTQTAFGLSQKKRLPTQLMNRDLEGHARPERRLLHHQHDSLAGQRTFAGSRRTADESRQIQQAEKGSFVDVCDREQTPVHRGSNRLKLYCILMHMSA